MDGSCTATWLTSAVDGLDHAVADEEFARTSARAHGRFAGMCEATVWPTSLATPPAGRCPMCSDRMASTQGPRRDAVANARRRPGLLSLPRWLVG